MPSILRQILALRRWQVATAQAKTPEAVWRERARQRQKRDFLAALRPLRGSSTGCPSVIAELKRASPSRGVIRSDFDIASLAATYQAAGASALSVLTEETHFGGRLEYLQQARAATDLPILRKDFTFCSYQIWEAAGAGADAVLLIAAMLEDTTWAELLAVSREAGVAAVSEVHDGDELERALRLGADCIGVNNRDLNTFQVDVGRAVELAPRIPSGSLSIAESGLRTHDHLRRMRAAGYTAALIGETFMAAPDPGRALAALLGGFVKVCGITTAGDAHQAAAAGADALGFVFAPSARQVTPAQAQAIIATLPPGLLRVGVFRGATVEEILDTAALCSLDRVQLHGAYSPAQGQAIAAHLPVWRALAMPASAGELQAWSRVAERFLLDSSLGGRTGGNGIAFDWNQVPSLRAQWPAARFLIAGGLNATNVSTAIERSGAFAVDAASGLEQQPGRKDPAAVHAFVANARTAFFGIQP